MLIIYMKFCVKKIYISVSISLCFYCNLQEKKILILVFLLLKHANLKRLIVLSYQIYMGILMINLDILNCFLL